MIFALLTLFTALAVSAVAGWFSIIGVMAIFAGAPYNAALVMGVVLELAKLVTISWIYRNWDFASWKLKAPLIYFTAALMLATSIGVFGFLSKSHLEQGAKTIDNGPKVERIEQQIAREKSIITDNEKVIAQLDATINSYLGKDRTDRSVTIRRSQAPQRKQLKDEIDAANKRIDTFSEEKFKLQSEIRSLELEVGPIRYIAELIYGTEGNSTKNIESAVKIFTLLIVSTLDPLAVILLVAANHTLLRRQNEKAEKESPEKSDATSQVGAENQQKEDTRDKRSDYARFSGLSESDNKEDQETEIYVQVSDAPLEVISEKEENTGSFAETSASISDVAEYEEPLAIIREILAEEPTSNPYIEGTTSVQEEINEEKASVLERPRPTRNIPSLAIIRTPLPSRVTEKETRSTEDNVPAVDVKISETQTPLVEMNAVMRELIGTGRHFIPQKVNEKEKNERVEIPDTSAGPTPEEGAYSEKIEEVPQEGQEEAEENKDLVSSLKGTLLVEKNHKYPKALSWLTEFTRTQNE